MPQRWSNAYGRYVRARAELIQAEVREGKNAEEIADWFQRVDAGQVRLIDMTPIDTIENPDYETWD